MVRLGAILISTGKSFQRRGPITEKARSPLRLSLECRIKVLVSKILGFSRGYTDAAIQIGSWVLDCCRDLKTNNTILKLTLN